MDSNDQESIRQAIEKLSGLEAAIFDRNSDLLYRDSILEVERAFDPNSGSKESIWQDFSWEQERNRRWNLIRVSNARHTWYSLCCNPQDITQPPQVFSGLTANNFVPDGRIQRCDFALKEGNAAELAQLRNHFRYTRVRLALSGWKLEHGSYPETLAELCDGENPWLEEVPCSFFSGREFAYSGQGLDSTVFFTPEPMTDYSESWLQSAYRNQFEVNQQFTDLWIEKEQPFLLPWSGVAGQKRPMLRRHEDEDGRKISDQKLEFAYWIPRGYAMAEHIDQIKAYLLKR